MSTRTATEEARPSPFVDRHSIMRDQGGQIDWDLVTDQYAEGAQAVQTSAAAAKGATSISVDALTAPIGIGRVLDFGARANVTVTVSSNAAQGATTIAVSALSGPIPNGTLLDFGSGAGLFALLTAAAAAGATSLTVEALPEAIASAKTATYTGGRKLARLSTKAALGATSLTVDALAFAIDDNDVAYTGGVPGTKRIPAYTVMVILSSGKRVPRSMRPGSETAARILLDPAAENSDTASKSGFGFARRGDCYENLLPDADSAGDLPSAYKTELEALGFTFIDFGDTRGD